MGTGYTLRPNSCWLPAGWVGRAVADCTAPHLTGAFAETVRESVEHVHLYPGAVASFEDASADEIRTFYAAARCGRDVAEHTGPKDWRTPEMFPGFLDAFDELLAYLASDARISGSSASEAAFPLSRKFHVTFFGDGRAV